MRTVPAEQGGREMEKEAYEALRMEVVVFETEDVIAASGLMGDTGGYHYP